MSPRRPTTTARRWSAGCSVLCRRSCCRLQHCSTPCGWPCADAEERGAQRRQGGGGTALALRRDAAQLRDHLVEVEELRRREGLAGGKVAQAAAGGDGHGAA